MHGRKTYVGKNIDYMMELVNEYLSGKTPRYIFELDFQTEILARYKKMVREDRDYAEYFYDMLSEDGVDAGDDLSDKEFKQLIRRQYNKVKSIAKDGFW
jgi:hypothetical protein